MVNNIAQNRSYTERDSIGVLPARFNQKTAELPEKPEILCEKMSISPWKTFQKGKVAHSEFFKTLPS